MELKLDSENLKVVVTAAIVESLGEDGKNELISSAIAHLLEDHKNHGRVTGKTVLQWRFDEAVAHAAQEIATELLKQEPWSTKLNELVKEGFDKALEDAEESIRTRISNGITRALT